MTAPIQKGTTMAIGFGSNVLTGYIMEDGLTIESTGETEIIKDEDNATVAVIESDPGRRIKFSAMIKSAVPTTDPRLKGATVTVNSVAYRIESCDVQFGRLVTKLSATAIKEAAMTYT